MDTSESGAGGELGDEIEGEVSSTCEEAAAAGSGVRGAAGPSGVQSGALGGNAAEDPLGDVLAPDEGDEDVDEVVLEEDDEEVVSLSEVGGLQGLSVSELGADGELISLEDNVLISTTIGEGEYAVLNWGGEEIVEMSSSETFEALEQELGESVSSAVEEGGDADEDIVLAGEVLEDDDEDDDDDDDDMEEVLDLEEEELEGEIEVENETLAPEEVPVGVNILQVSLGQLNGGADSTSGAVAPGAVTTGGAAVVGEGEDEDEVTTTEEEELRLTSSPFSASVTTSTATSAQLPSTSTVTVASSNMVSPSASPSAATGVSASATSPSGGSPASGASPAGRGPFSPQNSGISSSGNDQGRGNVPAAASPQRTADGVSSSRDKKQGTPPSESGIDTTSTSALQPPTANAAGQSSGVSSASDTAGRTSVAGGTSRSDSWSSARAVRRESSSASSSSADDTSASSEAQAVRQEQVVPDHPRSQQGDPLGAGSSSFSQPSGRALSSSVVSCSTSKQSQDSFQPRPAALRSEGLIKSNVSTSNSSSAPLPNTPSASTSEAAIKEPSAQSSKPLVKHTSVVSLTSKQAAASSSSSTSSSPSLAVVSEPAASSGKPTSQSLSPKPPSRFISSPSSTSVESSSKLPGTVTAQTSKSTSKPHTGGPTAGGPGKPVTSPSGVRSSVGSVSDPHKPRPVPSQNVQATVASGAGVTSKPEVNPTGPSGVQRPGIRSTGGPPRNPLQPIGSTPQASPLVAQSTARNQIQKPVGKPELLTKPPTAQPPKAPVTKPSVSQTNIPCVSSAVSNSSSMTGNLVPKSLTSNQGPSITQQPRPSTSNPIQSSPSLSSHSGNNLSKTSASSDRSSNFPAGPTPAPPTGPKMTPAVGIKPSSCTGDESGKEDPSPKDVTSGTSKGSVKSEVQQSGTNPEASASKVSANYEKTTKSNMSPAGNLIAKSVLQTTLQKGPTSSLPQKFVTAQPQKVVALQHGKSSSGESSSSRAESVPMKMTSQIKYSSTPGPSQTPSNTKVIQKAVQSQAVKQSSQPPAVKPLSQMPAPKPPGQMPVPKSSGHMPTPKLTGQISSPKPPDQMPSPKPCGPMAAPKPSGQMAAPKPSGQMAAPKPSGQMAAPKPSGQLPSTKQSGHLPTPKPSGQLPAPKPSGQLPAPKPSGKMAAPKPAGQIPDPKPAGQMPTPKSSYLQMPSMQDAQKPTGQGPETKHTPHSQISKPHGQTPAPKPLQTPQLQSTNQVASQKPVNQSQPSKLETQAGSSSQITKVPAPSRPVVKTESLSTGGGSMEENVPTTSSSPSVVKPGAGMPGPNARVQRPGTQSPRGLSPSQTRAGVLSPPLQRPLAPRAPITPSSQGIRSPLPSSTIRTSAPNPSPVPSHVRPTGQISSTNTSFTLEEPATIHPVAELGSQALRRDGVEDETKKRVSSGSSSSSASDDDVAIEVPTVASESGQTVNGAASTSVMIQKSRATSAEILSAQMSSAPDNSTDKSMDGDQNDQPASSLPSVKTHSLHTLDEESVPSTSKKKPPIPSISTQSSPVTEARTQKPNTQIQKQVTQNVPCENPTVGQKQNVAGSHPQKPLALDTSGEKSPMSGTLIHKPPVSSQKPGVPSSPKHDPAILSGPTQKPGVPDVSLQKSAVTGDSAQKCAVPGGSTQKSAAPSTPTPKSAVSNTSTHKSSVPGATTQRSPVPEATAQKPVVPGSQIQKPVVSGTAAQKPVLPAAQVQKPVPTAPEQKPVSGALMQKPAVPGAPVQKPAASNTPTQKPVVPGAPTQKPAVPGAPTQKPAVPSAATQKTVVPGASMQKPAVPGSPAHKLAVSSVPTQKPAVPSAPTQKSAVPSAPTQKPAVPSASTQKPAVPSAPTQKPAVPSAPTQKPAVPSAATQKPAVPGVPTQKPAVPGVPTQKPAVPSAATQKPVVPGASMQKPAVPGSPAHKPAVSSVPTQKSAVPTQKPAVPSSPTQKPAVPSSPTQKPAVPSAPTQKPAVPSASTQTVLGTPTQKPSLPSVPVQKAAVAGAPDQKAVDAPAQRPALSGVSAQKPSISSAPSQKTTSGSGQKPTVAGVAAQKPSELVKMSLKPVVLGTPPQKPVAAGYVTQESNTSTSLPKPAPIATSVQKLVTSVVTIQKSSEKQGHKPASDITTLASSSQPLAVSGTIVEKQENPMVSSQKSSSSDQLAQKSHPPEKKPAISDQPVQKGDVSHVADQKPGTSAQKSPNTGVQKPILLASETRKTDSIPKTVKNPVEIVPLAQKQNILNEPKQKLPSQKPPISDSSAQKSDISVALSDKKVSETSVQKISTVSVSEKIPTSVTASAKPVISGIPPEKTPTTSVTQQPPSSSVEPPTATVASQNVADNFSPSERISTDKVEPRASNSGAATSKLGEAGETIRFPPTCITTDLGGKSSVKSPELLSRKSIDTEKSEGKNEGISVLEPPSENLLQVKVVASSQKKSQLEVSQIAGDVSLEKVTDGVKKSDDVVQQKLSVIQEDPKVTSFKTIQRKPSTSHESITPKLQAVVSEALSGSESDLSVTQKRSVLVQETEEVQQSSQSQKSVTEYAQKTTVSSPDQKETSLRKAAASDSGVSLKELVASETSQVPEGSSLKQEESPRPPSEDKVKHERKEKSIIHSQSSSIITSTSSTSSTVSVTTTATAKLSKEKKEVVEKSGERVVSAQRPPGGKLGIVGRPPIGHRPLVIPLLSLEKKSSEKPTDLVLRRSPTEKSSSASNEESKYETADKEVVSSEKSIEELKDTNKVCIESGETLDATQKTQTQKEVVVSTVAVEEIVLSEEETPSKPSDDTNISSEIHESSKVPEEVVEALSKKSLIASSGDSSTKPAQIVLLKSSAITPKAGPSVIKTQGSKTVEKSEGKLLSAEEMEKHLPTSEAVAKELLAATQEGPKHPEVSSSSPSVVSDSKAHSVKSPLSIKVEDHPASGPKLSPITLKLVKDSDGKVDEYISLSPKFDTPRESEKLTLKLKRVGSPTVRELEAEDKVEKLTLKLKKDSGRSEVSSTTPSTSGNVSVEPVLKVSDDNEPKVGKLMLKLKDTEKGIVARISKGASGETQKTELEDEPKVEKLTLKLKKEPGEAGQHSPSSTMKPEDALKVEKLTLKLKVDSPSSQEVVDTEEPKVEKLMLKLKKDSVDMPSPKEKSSAEGQPSPKQEKLMLRIRKDSGSAEVSTGDVKKELCAEVESERITLTLVKDSSNSVSVKEKDSSEIKASELAIKEDKVEKLTLKLKKDPAKDSTTTLEKHGAGSSDKPKVEKLTLKLKSGNEEMSTVREDATSKESVEKFTLKLKESDVKVEKLTLKLKKDDVKEGTDSHDRSTAVDKLESQEGEEINQADEPDLTKEKEHDNKTECLKELEDKSAWENCSLTFGVKDDIKAENLVNIQHEEISIVAPCSVNEFENDVKGDLDASLSDSEIVMPKIESVESKYDIHFSTEDSSVLDTIISDSNEMSSNDPADITSKENLPFAEQEAASTSIVVKEHALRKSSHDIPSKITPKVACSIEQSPSTNPDEAKSVENSVDNATESLLDNVPACKQKLETAKVDSTLTKPEGSTEKSKRPNPKPEVSLSKTEQVEEIEIEEITPQGKSLALKSGFTVSKTAPARKAELSASKMQAPSKLEVAPTKGKLASPKSEIIVSKIGTRSSKTEPVISKIETRSSKLEVTLNKGKGAALKTASKGETLTHKLEASSSKGKLSSPRVEEIPQKGKSNGTKTVAAGAHGEVSLQSKTDVSKNSSKKKEVSVGTDEKNSLKRKEKVVIDDDDDDDCIILETHTTLKDPLLCEKTPMKRTSEGEKAGSVESGDASKLTLKLNKAAAWSVKSPSSADSRDTTLQDPLQVEAPGGPPAKRLRAASADASTTPTRAHRQREEMLARLPTSEVSVSLKRHDLAQRGDARADPTAKKMKVDEKLQECAVVVQEVCAPHGAKSPRLRSPPPLSITKSPPPASPVAITKTPSSTATISKAPSSSATISKAPSSSATISKAPSSSATISKTPTSTATITKTPSSIATITKAPTSTAIITKAPSSAIISKVSSSQGSMIKAKSPPPQSSSTTTSSSSSANRALDGKLREILSKIGGKASALLDCDVSISFASQAPEKPRLSEVAVSGGSGAGGSGGERAGGGQSEEVEIIMVPGGTRGRGRPRGRGNSQRGAHAQVYRGPPSQQLVVEPDIINIEPVITLDTDSPTPSPGPPGTLVRRKSRGRPRKSESMRPIPPALASLSPAAAAAAAALTSQLEVKVVPLSIPSQGTPSSLAHRGPPPPAPPPLPPGAPMPPMHPLRPKRPCRGRERPFVEPKKPRGGGAGRGRGARGGKRDLPALGAIPGLITGGGGVEADALAAAAAAAMRARASKAAAEAAEAAALASAEAALAAAAGPRAAGGPPQVSVFAVPPASPVSSPLQSTQGTIGLPTVAKDQPPAPGMPLSQQSSASLMSPKVVMPGESYSGTPGAIIQKRPSAAAVRKARAQAAAAARAQTLMAARAARAAKIQQETDPLKDDSELKDSTDGVSELADGSPSENVVDLEPSTPPSCFFSTPVTTSPALTVFGKSTSIPTEGSDIKDEEEADPPSGATTTSLASPAPPVVLLDEETRMSADISLIEGADGSTGTVEGDSRPPTPPARSLLPPATVPPQPAPAPMDVEMTEIADGGRATSTAAPAATPTAGAGGEESQGSGVSSATGDSGTPGVRRNKCRMEVCDPDAKEFTVDMLAEYQWPAGRQGDPLMLQEQVAQYLGVKSFKRKYPDLQRRAVEAEEKTYLREKGLVSDNLSDMGLTAINSVEVLDIMFTDFPEKYEEYRKHLRERQAKEMSLKQKLIAVTNNAERSRLDYKEKAASSAASWNAKFNKARREQRRACFDLQNLTVHFPASRVKKMKRDLPKLGHYPIALIPGQFTDYYKDYTPAELRYFPLNTVLYGPMKPNERQESAANSEGSQSDSDDSSSSDESSSSSSSEGTQDTEETGSTAGDTENAEGVSGPSKGDSGGAATEGSHPAQVNGRVGNAAGGNVGERTPVKDDSTAICKICGGDRNRNKESKGEVLIHCATCTSSCHPSCLDLTLDMVPHIRKYDWQCTDCKTCIQCKDPADEDKMLFCDMCDRGYHIYCVGLRRVPSGRWHCRECAVCGSCGSREPGPGPDAQWQHEYKKGTYGAAVDNKGGTPNRVYAQTLCIACSKLWRRGRYCQLCWRCFDAKTDEDSGLITCSVCDKMMHPECCSAVGGVELDRTNFLCEICQEKGHQCRASSLKLSMRPVVKLTYIDGY